MSRLIDADALKRKAQKAATEAWKMRITAKTETVLNQFIDWIENAPTIEYQGTEEGKMIDKLDIVSKNWAEDYITANGKQFINMLRDAFIAGFKKGAQLSKSNQKWIPCSERLPEEETDVLVTRTFLGCEDSSLGWNNHIPPKIYVEVAQYFCGEWTAYSDEYKVARSKHTDPIAWMPLPDPYKET